MADAPNLLKNGSSKTKNGFFSLSISVISDFLLQFGEGARRADEVRGWGRPKTNNFKKQ